MTTDSSCVSYEVRFSPGYHERATQWYVRMHGHERAARSPQTIADLAAMLAEVRAEERERCALVAEGTFADENWNTFYRSAGATCADAIRRTAKAPIGGGK